MHSAILQSPSCFPINAARIGFLRLHFVMAISQVWALLPAVSLGDEASEAKRILDRYCAGCHNANDQEGGFSVQDFDSILRGAESGKVLVPGRPDDSKLLHLVLGTAQPVMPPEDEDQPTDEEIDALRKWIVNGAKPPVEVAPVHPAFPSIAAAKQHYVGSACLVGDDRIAVGTLGKIALKRLSDGEVIWENSELPGKANAIRLSADGARLVVATGIAGVSGEVMLLDTQTGKVVQRMVGHSDAVYCASLSPDGSWLASGSYDRRVLIWDVATGSQRLELTGHNGAIYDLDISSDGAMLATASADQTVKLWRMPDGQRLDTFGQPEGEMRCVRFSIDGKGLFAGGADKQIRKWAIISREEPSINPMQFAVFAHEQSVQQISVTQNWVLSASDDLTVKLWRAGDLQSGGKVAELTDVPVALALADLGDQRLQSMVVELTGKIAELPISRQPDASMNAGDGALQIETPVADTLTVPAEKPQAEVANLNSESRQDLEGIQESEPNDSPETAMAIQLPATLEGVIENVGPLQSGAAAEDEDYFRFTAHKGEPWIFEVTAATEKSKLDSWLEVLDANGRSVLRTRLQAVRESYFTFRGKDSDTSDDFRMHKWEDMELDEYLYASGEVSRLWLYPRGPDSGFKVYPGAGSRYSFFGTTPTSHALGEPAYVVRELAADEEPLPNGLPVFPIYYENDDDPLRRKGADSRLDFVAPYTGEFILRVRDARGFGGPQHTYKIEVRRPQPDFSLKIAGTDLKMPIGSGREWTVQATRIDGMDGPISIELVGLPPGFIATNPLVIEAGQTTALGAIFATPDALAAMQDLQGEAPVVASSDKPSVVGDEAEVPKFLTKKVTLIARSRGTGKHRESWDILREFPDKLSLTLTEEREVQLRIFAHDDPQRELEILRIRPGQTISGRLVIDRNGDDSAISFGKDDSGRNLPHGCFVDNIGLNGLLIPEGQTEREFFITAAPKLKPGLHQFHLRTEAKGAATSIPIWLEVIDD